MKSYRALWCDLEIHSEGDVMIIKSDEKNRGKWQLGIVEKLIRGRDELVRAVKLRAGKSHLERPIQHLYPLELSCDHTVPKPLPCLNAKASEFRSKRAAAQVAKERIRGVLSQEQNEQ